MDSAAAASISASGGKSLSGESARFAAPHTPSRTPPEAAAGGDGEAATPGPSVVDLSAALPSLFLLGELESYPQGAPASLPDAD